MEKNLKKKNPVYIVYIYVHVYMCTYMCIYIHTWVFPRGSVVKNPPANAGAERDAGLIPGSGKVPAGGNSNPLQYSCLGNPMDRGALRATVHGVAESDTTELLSTHTVHPYVYTCIAPSRAAQLKLTQCHKSTVLQLKNKWLKTFETQEPLSSLLSRCFA